MECLVLFVDMVEEGGRGKMSIATIGFLVILLLFVFFLLGLEIGFSMALAGFIGFAAIVNVEAAMNLVAKDIFSVLSSYGFTVIAMFVFMGQVGASGGVARSLYDSAYKFIGHIPGGLALGTVVAATAFKAICGSSPATAATFATIAVPEMDRYGYDKRLSCGTVATVGTLGVLIPPSVVLIIYGITYGNFDWEAVSGRHHPRPDGGLLFCCHRSGLEHDQS